MLPFERLSVLEVKPLSRKSLDRLLDLLEPVLFGEFLRLLSSISRQLQSLLLHLLNNRLNFV